MAKQSKTQTAVPAAPTPAAAPEFKCEKCGRDFKSKLALAIHDGQVHKDKAKTDREARRAAKLAKAEAAPAKDKADRTAALTIRLPLRKVERLIGLLADAGMAGDVRVQVE